MFQGQKSPQSITLFARHKVTLALWFLFIFLVGFLVLYLLNIVPNELQPASTEPVPQETARETASVGGVPIRILADSISLDASVSNPESSDAKVLNQELLQGAVRYPGSGLLGDGNVFIFAHSSTLSFVNNPAYKTFSNLKKLQVGDLIRVQSESKEYVYQVAKVSLHDADKVIVDLATKRNMLTLSTCNVWGAKEQRYVIEADFVRSTSI